MTIMRIIRREKSFCVWGEGLLSEIGTGKKTAPIGMPLLTHLGWISLKLLCWARSRRMTMKLDGLSRQDPLSFFYANELIGFDIGDLVLLTAGPHDHEAHGLSCFRFTQTKRQWQFALGQIAGPRFYHAEQTGAVAGLDSHFGSDAVAIRTRADRPDAQHVIAISIVIPEQPRRAIISGDH